MKKIILLIVVLGLAGGGVFYWWQNQADVRELNKTLPEGIKVEKDKSQYGIINERQGYTLLLPESIKKLWKIDYSEKSGAEEMRYVCTLCKEASIIFVGLVVDVGDNITVESYRPIDPNIELETFAKEGNPTWLYRVDVEDIRVNDIDVIGTSREFEWGHLYNYFFKGESNFYHIEYISRELIEYIITNGKW